VFRRAGVVFASCRSSGRRRGGGGVGGGGGVVPSTTADLLLIRGWLGRPQSSHGPHPIGFLATAHWPSARPRRGSSGTPSAPVFITIPRRDRCRRGWSRLWSATHHPDRAFSAGHGRIGAAAARSTPGPGASRVVRSGPGLEHRSGDSLSPRVPHTTRAARRPPVWLTGGWAVRLVEATVMRVPTQPEPVTRHSSDFVGHRQPAGRRSHGAEPVARTI